MLSRLLQKSINLFNFLSTKKRVKARFIDLIPTNGEILEIGPFYSPICVGSNVKYFDILNQESLVDRAQKLGHGHYINRIPYIDYVSSTGDLAIIYRKFDTIVSSHVIEHQLDFIKHLQTVSNLLKEAGKYYLIIPDKRYCFDHFNNESTIADIINGNYIKREKHSLKSVIEHRAFITHNNARRHWKGDHGDIESNTHRVEAAISEYNTGVYIDVHAWYFTPNSFAKIIKSLNELGFIDFAISKIFPTPYKSLEFYVVLEKIMRNND